jgi:hypothetical protein
MSAERVQPEGLRKKRLFQAGGFAQLRGFVGFFPREMLAPKVAVGGGFSVDRVQQVQHLDQTVRAQIEELTYQQRQLFRSATFSVPKVSTMMEVGSATPMA